MAKLIVVAIDSPSCSLRCLAPGRVFRSCIVIDFTGSSWAKLLVAAALYSEESLPHYLGAEDVWWFRGRWRGLEVSSRRILRIVRRFVGSSDMVCVDGRSYRGRRVAEELRRIRGAAVAVAVPRDGAEARVDAVDRELEKVARRLWSEVSSSVREIPLSRGRLRGFVALRNRYSSKLCSYARDLAVKILSLVELRELQP
ncbi:MAG: hypothetical protein GXO32_06010 [Crenarchaeota archaeon]|nr:hypothetical protein [Thermoproteota archaeon]